MEAASAAPLSESQRRHLLISLQNLERLLAEIELIGRAAQNPAPASSGYRPDMTEAQWAALEAGLARIRARIVRILEHQRIARPPAETGALHAIRTSLVCAEVAVEELSAEAMRGYGELSPAQARALELENRQLLAAIRELLEQLRGRNPA